MVACLQTKWCVPASHLPACRAVLLLFSLSLKLDCSSGEGWQGLGKTVETIAVLLHRPFHPDAEAHATREEGPALGGTLIVTPPAIRRQWQQEV